MIEQPMDQRDPHRSLGLDACSASSPVPGPRLGHQRRACGGALALLRWPRLGPQNEDPGGTGIPVAGPTYAVLASVDRAAGPPSEAAPLRRLRASRWGPAALADVALRRQRGSAGS